MSAHAPPPAEPSVDLKNRWLAAGLALLVPGLGHLYQRRTFKAGVYFVCILGLFFTGQALGEWKVVYLGDSETGGRIAAGGGMVKRLLQGYAAQFPVGVVAWPAMIQSSRYHDPSNNDRVELDGPFSSSFEGGLFVDTINGPQPLVHVTGTISLEPTGGKVAGTFVGTTEDGKPIEFEIDRVQDLGRPISANEERSLEARIAALPEGLAEPNGETPYLKGALPRPFVNRYQVPLGEQGEDNLTAELGGRLEIAYVFTWIAGLLNVLAIWDALDGPAYGFGDGSERQRKKRRRAEEETDGPKPDPTRRPAPVA